MNAENMMKVIGEAKDEYIHSAQETRGQKRRRKPLSFVGKMMVAAAIVLSLATTVLAAGGLNITTLESGNLSKTYDSFQDMDEAMKLAGFQMDAQENFDSGYAFDSMNVSNVRGLDDKRNEKLEYRDIAIQLQNPAGHTLDLIARQNFESLSGSDYPASQTRQMGDIAVEYREANYRFLPADREGNLTQEEQLWQQQPGNFISYTSDEASQTKVIHVSWVKDGISYTLMDMGGAESPEVLFSMAGELING